MSKHLHRLGFKINNKFLEKNNFKKFICGDEIAAILRVIKSYSRDVLEKEWMADNVFKLPYTLNAINPAALLIEEESYENGLIEFYCHESLSKVELDRTVHLLTNSIEEFIEKHKEGLNAFDPTVNLDNVIISPILEGEVNVNFLKKNLSLIKVLFMRAVVNKPIFIGTSEDNKYIENGRLVKFFPTYSIQSGHILVSEIIEIEIENEIESMVYSITPNIEVVDEEIYIYPIIGIKRMVRKRRLSSIEGGTAKSYSVLFFDGKTYYFPRVAYRENKEKIKGIQMISQDWKLYSYLKQYKGISFYDIKEYLEGNDKENIHLIYSNKLRIKHKLNSGVPARDKLDIYNHIKLNAEGLEVIGSVEELETKRGISCLDNTDKLMLDKTIYRSDKTDLELLVIHPPISTLYEETISVIEGEKLIKNNSGLMILEDKSYSIKTGDDKIINLVVKDIVSIKGLEIKKDTETTEERLEKIINDIGEKSLNKLTMALIDLAYMGECDAKSIIRNSLDSYGIINQFIDSSTGINTNKVSSGLRDLLNDIGLGNANQMLEKNEVIYTLHKANKIAFICRIDNNAIEVKVPMVKEEYCHITDIYNVLPYVKDKTKDIYDDNDNIDYLIIDDFLKDIEQEKRDVIVILENGEVQYNTLVNKLNYDIEQKIKSYSKEYIITDLLGHQEVIQIRDDKVTLGTGIYKIKDGIYISIGDKGQDKTTTEASKIRRWENKHKKISIGAKIAYKDRIAYEIRIHKNKDADDMCELVHKLRLTTTMHSHVNRCLTTDYILGLAKHIE